MPAWKSLVLLAAALAAPLATPAAEDGFQPIFDGKTLDHWDGNPEFWRVEDGCITGQTTAEKPTKGNTFIIYRGGEVGDFELKLEYKIVGGNSGIQYRSFEVPDNKWVIGGYQADFEAGDTYSGINYGERFRGILANRGQKTVVKKGDDGKVKVEVVEQVGDTKEIQTHIKKEDWNTYHIIAKGYTFEHRINGVTTSICIDEHPDRRASGLIALQLHAGPPMKVQFKNIVVKKTDGSTAATGKKHALLLAGRRSHGFGAHDHTAGCALLAKLLNDSGLPITAEMHSLEKDGWPAAEKLAKANTIVIYADGGGGHPFNTHLEELQELTSKGAGIVCIHYGVETVTGPPGDAFLKWTGGFFEANYSVNPHWTANYRKFPTHPVTSGVEPFEINDEWYYHMRFREGMEGVTPILTDLPPLTTLVHVDAEGKPVMVEENGKQTYKLSRPENAHNNNPHARKAVIEDKQPQHMAWATENPNGQRGFGCSGGHVHWNWGNDQFRKLFLNAVVWTAGLDVPANGVSAGSVTVDDLLQHHDEEIPADFNKARIAAMLAEWNGK
ncbi:MAG: family 16 glycoside hydrolase [Planctomycetaceae bacterium]|nr:family 16 glycoside hydrolase [Planctomycetaceae bacterium]